MNTETFNRIRHIVGVLTRDLLVVLAFISLFFIYMASSISDGVILMISFLIFVYSALNVDNSEEIMMYRDQQA